MVKKFFLTTFFCVIFVGMARADNFQFLFKSDNGTYYVAYSNIVINYNSHEFDDYTDKYGQITIELPKGNYQCSIYYRRIWRKVNITIDGSKDLKKIYLETS